MPITSDLPTWRWTMIHGRHCVIYEADGTWYRTMCGKLVQGSGFFRAQTQRVKRRCQKCSVRVKIKVRDED